LDPAMNENILFIRARHGSNVPKFRSPELPLFFAINNDLFPGFEVPFIDMGTLQVEIEKATPKQSLQIHGMLAT